MPALHPSPSPFGIDNADSCGATSGDVCGLSPPCAEAPGFAVRYARVMFERTAFRAQLVGLKMTDACSQYGYRTVWHACIIGMCYVYRENKHQKGMVASGDAIACVISRN